MSFDYFVAVAEKNWPTFKAVQEALERLDYPVRLAVAPDIPFDASDGTLGMVFDGRQVEVEAEVEQASDADDPESLFGYIAQSASDAFSIRNGDYFLTLTFRSDADEIRAGLYLAAAMIHSFDGYGFENQYESHGQSEFAARMVNEAGDHNLWID